MKTTLIQKQQQKATTLKQRVCELLQWSEEEYANFQYEMGLQYLQVYVPGDPQGAEQLTHSKIYWNWWKNAWSARDEQFVNDAKPHWVVLEESYKSMIQEFIDEINHAV